MKIFKELKKLGYKHYTEQTVEELDDLPLNSEERIMEQALVLRWFREKYKLQVYIDFYHSESYFFKIKSQDGRYIGNTGDVILQGSPVFTRTYEEAELACLIKLIQIIKDGNK